MCDLYIVLESMIETKIYLNRKKFGNRLEPGRTDLSGNCLVLGEKEKDYQVPLLEMYFPLQTYFSFHIICSGASGYVFDV